MGGQWFLWYESQTRVKLKKSNGRLAHFDISVSDQQQPLASITSVYNYPHQSRQDEVWNELMFLSSSTSHPWIIGGDFNSILTSMEKVGENSPNWKSVANFQICLTFRKLVDLGFCGPSFTWTK